MARGTAWTPEQAERHLQSLELFGMRFGLERMRRLMTALGSPLENVRALQVVGTNGKSSTVRMIAAILQRHGYRAGAYMSPHLGSFAERIEIAEEPLPPEAFAAAVQRAAQAAELVDRGLPDGEHVTQFEALTAAAYWELGRREVEAVVVEAGLGGRYDATSVIAPAVVVLTNVGLEHTRWLGPTERHVAEEKLAVVPEGATLVAGPLGPGALEVAEGVAEEQNAALVRLGANLAVSDGRQAFAVRTPRRLYRELVLSPLGRFQRLNYALAVAAAEAFVGGPLDHVAVQRAARELVLPGRLEPVYENPLTVFDGAHNAAAVLALRESLREAIGQRKLTAVVSILDDKDATAMLSTLLPACERIVFTKSSHARALPPATLESLARQLGGPPAEVVGDPVTALTHARTIAGADGAVLVTGSLYLLSDLVRAAREGAVDAFTSAR